MDRWGNKKKVMIFFLGILVGLILREFVRYFWNI